MDWFKCHRLASLAQLFSFVKIPELISSLNLALRVNMILWAFRNTCLRKNSFGLFHPADSSQKKLFGMIIIHTQWIQFLFFSWDRIWQTMVHSLNLAHCLFLYSPRTKNGFYLFKCLGKKRISFCNTWTLYHFWISVQIKLYENTGT